MLRRKLLGDLRSQVRRLTKKVAVEGNWIQKSLESHFWTLYLWWEIILASLILSLLAWEMEMITHPVLLTEAVAVIKQHNKNWEVYSFADTTFLQVDWKLPWTIIMEYCKSRSSWWISGWSVPWRNTAFPHTTPTPCRKSQRMLSTGGPASWYLRMHQSLWGL